MKRLSNRRLTALTLALYAGTSTFLASAAQAQLSVKRLTPPSNLFTFNDPDPPYISRFVPGQRFDLQAIVSPDAGQTIVAAEFRVNGELVPGSVTLTPTTTGGFPPNTLHATLRAYSQTTSGVHILTVNAIQSDKRTVSATGNFEIVPIQQVGKKAKNVIVLIGDGMGIAHRTAARIMLHGASQGKANGRLAMDQASHTGIVMTHSLNSIVTDSSPGASCYSSGNKANNNQHGVWPDATTAHFDNPRVELITEYLHRVSGKTLGFVTTSDVFDATPAAWSSHTQSRSAGTGICDQYLDDAEDTGMRVVMGGGRKWYLPQGMPGSARGTSTDYTLPEELWSAWDIAPGAIDPRRDLIADHEAAGFTYVADRTELDAIDPGTEKLLGLFAYSNMNVAKDKIDGRRGDSTIVNDYGFPDQPMLDEMTDKALQVLSKNPNGFVLMVEGASIDKQAHAMDTERWILDTIEFDRAVGVSLDFAATHPDTLVVVTADHECAGINIIGASLVTNAELVDRSDNGDGATSLRTGVVGVYESAGFPQYVIAEDGYPETTDIDYRMLIGYAGNADRYEDWLTNPLPLRDSQQPFNNQPPLSDYPNGPLNRDVLGNFLVTGQVGGTSAVHTASDIPIRQRPRGQALCRRHGQHRRLFQDHANRARRIDQLMAREQETNSNEISKCPLSARALRHARGGSDHQRQRSSLV